MQTYSLLTGFLFATHTKFHTLVYYKKLHMSIFKKPLLHVPAIIYSHLQRAPVYTKGHIERQHIAL